LVWAGSDFVVNAFFDRRTPRTPAKRISRSVWSRPMSPLAAQQGVHLPAAVDAVVLRVQSGDLGHQQVITQLPGRRRPGLRGTVAAGGEEPTNCRAQHPADGLDPEPILVLVDVADHLVLGRSSSLAKNTLADFKISFARRNSATSRRSRFSSSVASVVTPGARPWSISTRRA